MSFCLKSWLIGFMLGQADKPKELESKTPVAYLYNGVGPLPALPEWAGKEFSWVSIIWSVTSEEYFIIGYSTKPVTTVHSNPYTETTYDQISMESDGLYKHVMHEDGTWYNPDETNEGNYKVNISNIVWSNFDIYDSEGKIYLAASEPVPVYE